jgi:hypothetical protein
MHFAFDVAKLQHRQPDHNGHQHYRLRGRATEVHGFEAVKVDLVDQDGGVLTRATSGGGVHNSKGFKKSVHRVDHQQEKQGRREQGQLHCPKTLPNASAIDSRSFDQGFGDALKAC